MLAFVRRFCNVYRSNEVPNRQKVRQKIKQKGNFMERDYEEIFQKVLDYEQTLHEKNRKRIKIGLKCIWIVPLFFLALLFLTGSNKVIFLILWIVSLFALSIYLIVVEYMDYNLQEKIMELKGEEGTIEAVTPADFDRAAQIIRKTQICACGPKFAGYGKIRRVICVTFGRYLPLTSVGSAIM